MDINSDSDLSDYETPSYNQTNPQADTFRAAISEWKQKQLDSILGDNQDTQALNAYLKKTKETYQSIKNYIESKSDETRIDKELLISMGDPKTYSPDTRINILHTLTRDLLEFPFTFDRALTNSFTDDEAVQTKIIPNK